MTEPKHIGSRRALTNSFTLLAFGALLFVFLGFVVAEDPAHYWVSHFGTLVVVGGYFAVGGWAWLRRPSNAMGFLTVAAGFCLLMGVFSSASFEELMLLGGFFSLMTLALTAHILIAFPNGYLGTRPARIVVSAAYFAVLCYQTLNTLVALNSYLTATPWFAVLRVALALSVAVFALGSVCILTARWFRAPKVARAALLPLYLYGAIAILAVSYLPEFLTASLLLYYVQILLLLGVPIVFVITALRGRFSRSGEINSLGIALGATWEVPGDLSATLARIFGDSEAKVVFWSDEQQGFLTFDGEVLEVPPEFDGAAKRFGEDLARITLQHQERTVGAILFRPQIVMDVGLVQSAAKVLLMAVERGQLTAQLKANQTLLHESRLRVLTAADTERARIAQNLHDGVQAHLVLLTMEAGTLINELQTQDGQQASPQSSGADKVVPRLEGLRRNIDLAAAELRELVYDVMPPLLLERDLNDALEVLTDRVPINTTLSVTESLRQGQRDLPDEVMSTVYFVVVESLTNAIKHSTATEIQVEVDLANDVIAVSVADNGAITSLPVMGRAGFTRFGLRGLRDRVETLGGQFHLRFASEDDGAEPGMTRAASGLRVQAVIPCA